MSLPDLQAGQWPPEKSPVTDNAAGQIQAAYRRRRGQKRVSRALFQGDNAASSAAALSAAGAPCDDEADVVAHAQGVEDAVRSSMARVARTRKAHVVSVLLPLLSGDETAANEFVASLERWHKRSDEGQLGELRAECEKRMRRVAAAARRQAHDQLKKAKKQEEARIERVRRAAYAEADETQENARIALHDAEMEWSARVDELVEENADLASRLQSAESSLSKRQDDVQHEAELGQSAAAALRRQCSLLQKQLRRAESRIASQQHDLAASEKDCAQYKGRIGALESSTAAAWAASYASSQKPSEHCARHNPGAASTPAAAAAAKRNTTSVVMTLPSPSKLRSASSRSALLGKRSSESTSKNNSDPPPVPPASPPRWRRDRFQMDTATTAARSISGTVDTGSPLRPRVPSGLSARSNTAHTPGRARAGGRSVRMTLGAQAPDASSVVPALPTLASNSGATVSHCEPHKAMGARETVDSTSNDDGMDLMTVSPGQAITEARNVGRRVGDAGGGHDLQPAALNFELPATVKASTTIPAATAAATTAKLPPANQITWGENSGDVDGDASTQSGGGESQDAVVPRARRGADHLVDKLVRHLDTDESDGDAADAVVRGPVAPPTTADFDLPPVLGSGTGFSGGQFSLLQAEDLLRPHEPAKLAPLVVPISSRSSEAEQQEQKQELMQLHRISSTAMRGEQDQESVAHDGPSPVASDLSSPSISPTGRVEGEGGISGDGSNGTMATKQFVANVVNPTSTAHPVTAAPLAVRPRFDPGTIDIQGPVNVAQPLLGQQPSVFHPRPPAAARTMTDGAIAVSAPQLHGRRRQFFSSRGTATDGGTDGSGASSAAAKLADLRGGTGSARPFVPMPPSIMQQPQKAPGGVLMDSRAPPPPSPGGFQFGDVECGKNAMGSGQQLLKPHPPGRTNGLAERRGSVSKPQGDAARVRRGSNVAGRGGAEHLGATQQDTRVGIGRLVGIATGTTAS